MINGIPGNVAMIIARHVINDQRFVLVPASLTGPDIIESSIQCQGKSINLVKPGQREAVILEIQETWPFFIAVDYTHPSAVNANADFYVKHNIPFVMGTTGGDRDRLHATVLSGSVPAVIAPNMVKQIVGFQAMMEYAAETFPGLFKGYSLTIEESHQSTKADTSGTARAMVGYFNRLGIPFTDGDIVRERDRDRQKSVWNIPEEHLAGHGWHTYTLSSPEQGAFFQFKHNINGRDIYVQGTLDGVLFLQHHISSGGNHGTTGKVFSMIDVLKGN